MKTVKSGSIIYRQAERFIGLTPGGTAAPILADHASILATQLEVWRNSGNIDFDLLQMSTSNTLVRTRFVPVKGNGRVNTVIFLEDKRRFIL